MDYQFGRLAAVFEQVAQSAPAGMGAVVKAHPRVFVYGAGRSGLMLKAFAMRLAQAGRTVYVVGETVTPAITKDDVLILASASGKTPSVLRYAQTAKDVGADLYSLTASPDSPLAALSDGLVCLPAPTKDSAPQTSIMGTVFEQAVLLFCDLVVQELSEDVAQMRLRHANLE